MKWRYVHRDRVPAYERKGWIRAIGTHGTGNLYFVLMMKD